MSNKIPVFITLCQSPEDIKPIKLLVQSIRMFSGDSQHSPIWIFNTYKNLVLDQAQFDPDTRIHPLDPPSHVRNYLFGNKVAACARAEEFASREYNSLVWIDPLCLVLKPPYQFILNNYYDAALRPVHIRNVGLLSTEPLNDYWRGIIELTGTSRTQFALESFVDGLQIRPYFNSHAFSINPKLGLMKEWLVLFEQLLTDKDFQQKHSKENRDRIFLFQALLSALLISRVEKNRIRILTPDYNYPYHMHSQVPLYKKAKSLNELTCVAYEETNIYPEEVRDILIEGPLFGWLRNSIDQFRKETF